VPEDKDQVRLSDPWMILWWLFCVSASVWMFVCADWWVGRWVGASMIIFLFFFLDELGGGIPSSFPALST